MPNRTSTATVRLMWVRALAIVRAGVIVVATVVAAAGVRVVADVDAGAVDVPVGVGAEGTVVTEAGAAEAGTKRLLPRIFTDSHG